MTTQTWNFDPAHSTIGFSIKHMMFAKVRGSFGEWSGELHYDPKDPSSAKVRASIDVASIDTGNKDRDEHLRSGDFFNVEEHPRMTFESTSFKGSPESMTVTGTLTIRDVSKEVELDVEQTGTGIDPWGNRRVGFRISAKINRKDFGLTWNQALETGGVLVGEDVSIDIEIQAVAEEQEDQASA